MREAIFDAVRSIPRGSVAAYGEVAARAGLPRRARLVGKVLRDSSPDDRLPWHRVVRADGSLAFPEGSSSFQRQVARLEGEGVALVHGRVPKKFFTWRRGDEQDLDAVLWGDPS